MYISEDTVKKLFVLDKKNIWSLFSQQKRFIVPTKFWLV